MKNRIHLQCIWLLIIGYKLRVLRLYLYNRYSHSGEYRLLLRHDNADRRLYKYGHQFGLIDEERYNDFLKKEDKINKLKDDIDKFYFGVNEELSSYVESVSGSPVRPSTNASSVIKRPGVKLEELIKYLKETKEEVFIIGGCQIYKASLDIVDRMYITHINAEHEGNVFFPEIDYSKFNKISQRDSGDLSFCVYERK